MDYEGFLTTVAEAAHVDRDAAERATRATLQTLAARIAPGEAQDLATQLPPELGPWLATDTPAEGFDLDEFLRRAADREGIDDLALAERYASAVLLALGRAVSGDEFDDMASELPREFDRLLPKGRPIEVPALDVFLGKVARRARIDGEDARRATEAVLETLAERIAGGEVDDLIARFPVELHAPLARGKERSGGQATRMPVEEFVRRVAEREGVTVDQATEHARAVLATLREELPDTEFHDVTDQLPHEYDALLAHG